MLIHEDLNKSRSGGVLLMRTGCMLKDLNELVLVILGKSLLKPNMHHLNTNKAAKRWWWTFAAINPLCGPGQYGQHLYTGSHIFLFPTKAQVFLMREKKCTFYESVVGSIPFCLRAYGAIWFSWIFKAPISFTTSWQVRVSATADVGDNLAGQNGSGDHSTNECTAPQFQFCC